MTEQAECATELPLELSASYAHRVGDHLHVVLQLADAGAGDVPAELELRAGKRTVRVPVTAAGAGLDAVVPLARLRPGLWRVALVGPDGDVRPVQGRLLNSRRQPVALLPGPVPSTQLAPPQPSRRRRAPPPPPPRSGGCRTGRS